MYEILREVVKRLKVHQLEEIYIVNKLNLQGFRINGPSTPAKTERMKKLLINNPKLEMILKKTADIYRIQKNKDLSWALASDVDVNIIKEKIEETNIAEVTYGLIEANKLNLLQEILFDSNKTDNSLENEQIKKEDDRENTTLKLNADILELRGIIRDLEDKNKKLSLNLQDVRNDLSDLNKENKVLNQKLKDIVEDFDEKSKEYLQCQNDLNISKENLLISEGNNGNLLLQNNNLLIELDSTSFLNFLFYGTKFYRKLIETKAAEIQKLKYDYVDDLTEVQNYKQYQKLIVLTFTLNKKEEQDLMNFELIEYFKDLYDLVIISSLEQLNDYLNKVGNYYE